MKKFSDIIVADEREADRELSLYARELHLGVPAQLDPSQQTAIDRLAALHDAAFDREFLMVIVQRHQELLDQLRTAATAPSLALALTNKSSTRMTRLAEWSAHTLPRVQHHLTRAQELLAR